MLPKVVVPTTSGALEKIFVYKYKIIKIQDSFAKPDSSALGCVLLMAVVLPMFETFR